MSPVGYIATVGTFDGVHRGHRHLLAQLADKAGELGLRPLALVIDGHPLAAIKPGSEPPALSVPSQRIAMIESLCGIEARTIALSADDYALTADSFLLRLKDEFGVKAFMMGFNNHIGSDRATPADLIDAPLPVFSATGLPCADVSSSAIRNALIKGDIACATAFLGHTYSFCGRVTHGRKLGRSIGYPTANVEGLVPGLLLPAPGVYAVETRVEGFNMPFKGMANIGVRPTVNKGGEPSTFEVNIFGFDADIYGREIEVGFIRRLRDERRFDSISSLVAQLDADRAEAMK